MLADKIKEYTDRKYSYKITFEYERDYVTCTLKRPYVHHLAVWKVAGTDEQALDLCLKLLNKVKFIEDKMGEIIKAPSLDKQKYNGGYYREIRFEDYEIEFRRHYDTYVITDIRRKDKNGFYFVEEPYEVTDRYFKCEKDEFHGYAVKDFIGILEEGESLYAWDDIQFLSGSAGFVIVKDGKVIKTRGMVIS